MQKRKNIPTLKKELLILISRYVKLKYADDKGYCYCYTCGARVHISTSFCQVGHCFSKSGYPALQFNLNNLRIQDDRCNITLNGNEAEFKKRLKEELGENLYSWLEAHKNDTVKLDRSELESCIEDFKGRIKSLEDRF